MKNLIILVVVGLINFVQLANAAVSLREPVRNFLSTEEESTLDKVRLIGNTGSGKCLIIENKKRLGTTRENQLVLWDCHDRQIKGLEQQMFMFIKSNGGGYLFMGYAGSVDKCVSAERGYYDHVVIKKCDPSNENQSWIIRRVEGSKEKYQIVQMSTGRCIRAPGIHDGAWVRVGDCELTDSQQIWNICRLNGSCD